MTTKVIQIEGIEADTLLARLDRMESALTVLTGKPQQAIVNTSQTEYITRRNVADLFKISLVTVNDWTNKGLLIAYKVAKRVYYKREEVEAALIQKGGAK